MIVKQLEPFVSQDVLARAGRAAEEQMAFYLHRAFADDPQVAVLNGIRLVRGADASQMDHLLLHPYGAIIIESKSITTRVRVNERGEWARFHGRTPKGMPSPILQAERQADFLARYLREHSEVLGTLKLAINVRVAISDGAIIDRSKHEDLDRTLKADAIPQDIRDTMQARKVIQAIPALFARALAGAVGGTVGDPIPPDVLRRLAAFLVEHHRPLRMKPDAPIQIQTINHAPARPEHSLPATSQAVPTCRKCGTSAFTVEFGYSYYYKCLQCKASTGVQYTCGACGSKERIRKASNDFFRDCPRCGTSIRFHTNGVRM